MHCPMFCSKHGNSYIGDVRNMSCMIATAGEAEKRKHLRYDELCRLNGWTMVPFALESYGGLGKEGRRLQETFAIWEDELSVPSFLAHATSLLSVALQIGNARVAADGVGRANIKAQCEVSNRNSSSDFPKR